MANEKNWIMCDFIDYLHNHFDLYFVYGQDNYDSKTEELKFPLKCYGEYRNQFIEEMKEYLTEKGKRKLLNNSGYTNDFILKEITEDFLILTFK